MTAGLIALVLTASLSHAVWNAIAKTVPGHGYAFVFCYQSTQAVLLIVTAATLTAVGGGPDPGLAGGVRGAITANGWPLLVAGVITGVLHVAYSLSLQTGYDRGELSVVYPVARGVGPLVTIIVSVLFLGQHPGLLGLLGGVLVIAGISVVTVLGSRRAAPDTAEPQPAAHGATASHAGGRLRAGLAWGALTGLSIAGYTLWDDFSVNRVTDSPVLYYGLGCVSVSLLMLPRALRIRGEVAVVFRRYWRQVLGVAVLSSLAYLLVLFAMQHASVALVAPLRETSIIVGTFLAWWFFGERGLLPKLLGTVVVLAGIACIALA